MLATVPILLGWLFTVCVSYAAGYFLLAIVPQKLFKQEEHFFRFVLGAACFSLIVFLLTSAKLAFAGVFAAVGVLILILALLRSRRPARQAVPLPDFPWIWKLTFFACIAVFGVYYFVHALAPETSPDGATYHLGIVARYLRQHGFGHITTDMYANLSEGIEMLFMVAFSLGRHSAAALVEFTFLLMLPWGMLSYARRIGFPQAGVLAALLVYASPVFGISGTVAYNDAAGACILFATFYALQIWAETQDARWLPVIGCLAGFCFGAKYTLFLALPFAGVFILWKLWRARKPMLRPLVIYSACALLMVVPWMAKNWVTVRNPFSPFANLVFPNHYITPQFEQEYSELMRNRPGLTQAERPLDHIVFGARTSGLLGPVFLLAPLALLALRFRAGRQLLLATLVFLLPAYTNVETRFLMAMLPFLALSLALAVSSVPGGIPILLAFHLLTAWPSSVPSYAAPFAWHLEDFNPAEAFRLIPEITTLRKRLPDIQIAEMLDRETPANSRIFTFSNPPEAYISREIVVKYESALGNRLGEILWTALNAEFQPKREFSFNFEPVSLEAFRLVQTANHPPDAWSIAELHVWNGEAELAPDRSWSSTASANPWDTGLVFDRRLITRWSTVQAFHPGMYLEVNLGQPRQISRVSMETALEWFVRLQFEIRREGKWRVLLKSPAERFLPADLELRRQATAELKREGMTHLLVSQDSYGDDNFFSQQSAWGIQLVGTAPGSRLYKLL